eukprot:6215838-Amphidinium_carterae.1
MQRLYHKGPKCTAGVAMGKTLPCNGRTMFTTTLRFKAPIEPKDMLKLKCSMSLMSSRKLI